MPTVTISQNGPSGEVRYSDGQGSLRGYWEFGGEDVVTIVSMGTRNEWERSHPWALAERTNILRTVAAEVIRQRCPGCVATFDEQRGDILLRQAGNGPYVAAAPDTTAHVKAAHFVQRYATIKAMVGIGVLVVVLVGGALFWVGKKALTVTGASGVPLGECVRTNGFIVSLIRTSDGHLPDISGRGGNATSSIRILLLPETGGAPRSVQLATGLSQGAFSLARIFGSDGRTLWADVAGLHGVRLSDAAHITPQDLRAANATLDASWWEDTRGMDIVDGKLHILHSDRSAAMDVDPVTLRAVAVAPKSNDERFHQPHKEDLLAAGFLTAQGTWLGLHAAEELEGALKPGAFVRTVERASDARRSQRLCAADVERSTDGKHLRIITIAPLSDVDHLDAAFLRMDAASLPVQLNDPEGTLMVHTTASDARGTLMVSRVDTDGHVRWSVDTGLDRFALQQILPGAEAFAFVGPRPHVPGKLSEPFVVLVENSSGALTSHSLWR
ncbi:MAG: hypothetical protein JNM62_13840 [Flavobacteriales bacterium]|nr:hypothetical protein [Flavobacteriales bacterium]